MDLQIRWYCKIGHILHAFFPSPGLDMWMNTPNDQFYRAARINQDPIWKFLLKAFMVPKYAKIFTNFILFPKSVFARSTQTVAELAEVSIACFILTTNVRQVIIYA
jgi:hypothetical protein